VCISSAGLVRTVTVTEVNIPIVLIYLSLYQALYSLMPQRLRLVVQVNKYIVSALCVPVQKLSGSVLYGLGCVLRARSYLARNIPHVDPIVTISNCFFARDNVVDNHNHPITNASSVSMASLLSPSTNSKSVRRAILVTNFPEQI
jgi:hypothetical protein